MVPIMADEQIKLDQTQSNLDLPDHVSKVSLRRLKKREVDRRCQRQAREKKRSQIVHLESLVDQLRSQDASGQVEALLTKLQKVEQERDMLTKTLKSIQQIMTNKLPGLVEEGEDEGHNNDTAKNHVLPSTNGSPSQYDTRFNSRAIHRQMSRSASGAIVQHRGAAEQQATTSSTMYDWVNPKSSCCCHVHVDRPAGHRATWQGNYWKFVSEVLDERLDWSDDIRPADDVESEDVFIRAVIEGWDAVAKDTPLHPAWDMLRRIDEGLFRPIARAERLGMLRAMHLLIQYHTEPTAQRYKRLPPWYLYRPSQYIEHTHAIDYYAWPTFRQRFIFSPHAYCGNEFWRIYQSELKLLWPFEFRDCYTHDLETGLYKPSRLFEETMNNVKCWTMGSDFFQRFPELSSDIPVSGRIPKALPAASDLVESRSQRRSSAAPAESVHATSTRLVELEEMETEDQEQEYQQLQMQQFDDWAGSNVSAFEQPHATSNPHLQLDTMSSLSGQSHTLFTLHQDYSSQQSVFDPWCLSSDTDYNVSDFDFDPSAFTDPIIDAFTVPSMTEPGYGADIMSFVGVNSSYPST